MQNASADADDTPGNCRECYQRDYIHPKSPVYIRLGLTPKVDIVICGGGTFLLAQGITPFRKSRYTACPLAEY